MSRILCVWSPNWAIETWRRRRPSAPQAEPFALAGLSRGLRVLTAVSPQAAAAGLFPGQGLTDARALRPDLVLAEAEPEADARALEALADWCVRFSPAVAPDPPDGLFLDIGGVAHLWGGEAEMAADLAARLARDGLTARIAVAGTAGAAWALARSPAAEAGPRILAPGGPGDGAPPPELAGLPAAALRLEPAAVERLARLGLRRIGQLTALPRGPLAKRFGAGVLLRLDQALGRAPEALAFRRPPTPWFFRLDLAEPVSAPEDLARLCRDAALGLCARLEASGRGARRFRLDFHRVDGAPVDLELGLSRPACDPERLARLFLPRLETLDPGFGIEAVSLQAAEAEVLTPGQADLASLLEPVEGPEALAPLIDRLTARLGARRVWRSRPLASHVPERSVRRTAALEVAAGPAGGWPAWRPRPLRLLPRPEPLEGVIALTPDEPPRQFRWRRRVHRIHLAEGPERIGAEWWRTGIEAVRTDQVRDYYRVEDQDGARFWVFRSGLHDHDRPVRWWLHGLFG
ncbi:MAG: DNA polymerase Y family protein [Phenylobacterium sp.]|uniref:Y-family DNA polymerase n=1 Tax=Phenylobacterium sp. TaxID=1871053 RepID=UPI0025CCBDEF|nr:DNA polymerase Y family protein [Phenylobacterium sp.]MCA6232087.1 DNA polymerase Y family protein [Phenylobacterium sp.]MCA6264422.1 DNA polymerase Y family protein [Phenylobacterium sp.]MCA6266608.1 DNA polymerase Y family protein [Phenylobacterium sp.]MCA6270875.1 DNA polymerase Y family protein [Phenylobacterium sp.]MCA6280048.1 DNA polymerase Y family protein [Phenylobacterium sp.]